MSTLQELQLLTDDELARALIETEKERDTARRERDEARDVLGDMASEFEAEKRCTERQRAALASIAREVRKHPMTSARALRVRHLAEQAIDTSEVAVVSWVVALMKERPQLVDALLQSGCCAETRHGPYRAHAPDCRRGALLRLVGGPEETQRQVDAAHEEANIVNWAQGHPTGYVGIATHDTSEIHDIWAPRRPWVVEVVQHQYRSDFHETGSNIPPPPEEPKP